jgi:hypothetical protein
VAAALLDEGKLKSLHSAIYLEGLAEVAGTWAALDATLRNKLSALSYRDPQTATGILFCLLVNYFRGLEKLKQGRSAVDKPLARLALELEDRMAVLSEITGALLGVTAPMEASSFETLRSELHQ